MRTRLVYSLMGTLFFFVACTGSNGTQSDASPTPLECEVGAGDCNADPSDGCETVLNADPSNCNSCGISCEEGQVCSLSGCIADTRMIVDLESPIGLVVDETHVYWISAGITDALQNPGTGRLMRVRKIGSEQPEMVADDLDVTQISTSLIVDTTYLYWVNPGSEGLWKVPKDGSAAPVNLAVGTVPSALKQNKSSLFFIEGEIPNRILVSVEKGGENRTVLASNVFDYSSPLYVDENSLYYAKGSAIMRIPVDGSGEEETIVADAGGEVSHILVKTGSVFWTTSDTDMVRVRRWDDDTALNIAIEPGVNPVGLEMDDENVYFAFCKSGTGSQCNVIAQVSKSPGETALVVQGQGPIPAFTMDETHFYWLTTGNEADGALHRLSR